MTATTVKTTEETVREVLGKTYDRFGFSEDVEFVRDIVVLMETPTVTYEGGMSDAAEAVRNRLWGRYTGGGASASATCDLFVALGRENELGWLAEWMSK
jgi:hypothetical protein